MANTIIQLKHSTVTGNVPVALANGEISINSRDGKLFYATPSGVVTAFNPYPGPSGLDTEIQFNDAGSLGGSEKLTFNKTTGLLTVNGTVRANIFSDDGTDLLVFANNAYNTANSKTQVYQQNNAPSTAGATDFWIANTGVMYENFGNTTNPVWAEVGPTSVASNTLPGAVVATTLTTSNTAFITYTPPTTINAAIQVYAANTKGGTGYADFLMATNISGGATNPNKYFRLDSTGILSIVNSAYTNTLLTLDDSGNLALAGNVTSSGVQSSYNANRPAFRVYGANTTGPLTTTQNGTGQLNYNNWALDYNQGSYLNYTSGTFTAPVAGLYQINMNVRNAGNASYSQLICYKNSSTVMICIEFAGSSTMNHTGGSTIAKLAAGDTLIIKVAAGTITFDGNDNWSVAYLG